MPNRTMLAIGLAVIMIGVSLALLPGQERQQSLREERPHDAVAEA